MIERSPNEPLQAVEQLQSDEFEHFVIPTVKKQMTT